ncbi:MAG TPA: glutamate-5-semialdehyde dehydrogenase [Candidatus Aveggerthella excrementigallinarum]|nr:glutamate-5-semialdehyde dehydrogenase [Candidatus Aveggerthella excrementigallinarum]
MTESVERDVRMLAEAAKAASTELGMASFDQRNEALRAMAAALRARAEEVLEANAEDMDAARADGMSASLLDRLLLTRDRVEGMAAALEELAALPDSLGRVLEDRTLENGLRVQRVTVPFGVVAMVYEARPNVTADAAGICVKTGNACVLRSGSSALRSSVAIARVLADAAESAGLSKGSICIVESADRASADALMRLHGVVDLLIPRGGAGLIRRCVENATVPVIETGTGNCHVYVHETADFAKARAIVMNAKTQRTGVCNACESLLVDRAVASAFLPEMLAELAAAGVLVHGDAVARACAEQAGALAQFVDATEDDWGTEYLALEISVKAVDGLDEAIAHINRYGTHHSDAIVAEDAAAGERFLAAVDSAAVYVNASTRFTDGGQFGLGAEIGISTQKLHARGPFAADALTSYKYVIRGAGQVRP